jgi:hypothetical protein
VFGAEDEYVRLNAFMLEFFDRVLSRFGFKLAGSSHVRHISEVDAEAVATELPTELAHTFDIRQRFDVAYSTTDFGDNEVEIASVAELFYVAFDFVGDMRDDLNSFAQEIATTFASDYVLIYATRCNVVGLRRRDVEETLVVTEVEVGFVTIVSHVALAMFVRIESTWVDVDIRVEFLVSNSVTTSLEEFAKRSCDDAFTER